VLAQPSGSATLGLPALVMHRTIDYPPSPLQKPLYFRSLFDSTSTARVFKPGASRYRAVSNFS
jgi:hypothetical protein